ncbi:MAG: hypothetical protein IKX56_02005 [Muribaculaceae bacterium]|nr:hypothetical protein [Muribaculaceae bacterium]
MKRLLLCIVCLATMMVAGTGLRAQEVTITLMPGLTWIGIPGTEPQDFAAALGPFTPMEGDVIKSQWGNATYTGGRWRGTISQFYPGYGYKYYSSRTVPVTLTFNPQQPAPQVVVTTSEPMMVTGNSAMGGGNVTVSDGTYILVRGLCWATHENPTTNDDFFVEEGSGTGNFTATMTGLNISTTYYVRAYAVTPSGTVYGEQQTFTTRDGIPTLTTDSIMDITGTTATCGGNITDNGGLNVTARGVCWSTSPNPTVSDSHTTNGTGSGTFTSSITGLEVSTTYYVRAYAITNAGTAYGNEMSFTTRDGIPTLTTTDITNITGKSARSGGNITDNCGLNVTARGVCWSTSPNPTVSDSHTTNGIGTGTFISSITGLNVSTTYYVRAYATTSAGTAYGNEVSFTTRDGIPTLTTEAILNITGNSARSGGSITDDGGLDITARGVCWSTSPNPAVSEGHTTNGSGTGTFTSNITGLEVNTTYYVRAYAITNAGTGYGDEVSFTTRNGIPTLDTWAIWNITGNSARSGGNITDDGGLNVTSRGICWSTSPNPTVSDSHTTNGIGIGAFNSFIMDLDFSTTYYIRAYATTNAGTYYGNQLSFTTENDLGFIDLGLPSGLLWATCNVGADSPENYGDYFAWGETQPKDYYGWNTYLYCMGNNNTLTKYCNNSSYGYNGFTDNLTTLLPEDDAATANWGDDWRIPTQAEFQELLDNTTVTWTTQNGVNGRLFTASNSNSLFLPAAGYCTFNDLFDADSYGHYWSNSLNTGNPSNALFFDFTSDNGHMNSTSRLSGHSVRPVRSGLQNTSFTINITANPVEGGVVIGGGSYQEGVECTLMATANQGYVFINWTENGEIVSTDAIYTFTLNANRTLVANFTHAYVDLGLPSGLLWATCNIGASNPERYGNYYAWGETTTKSDYSWSTYQYCNGGSSTLTKYCSNSSYGYNGFTDNLTTLLSEDDAATANWGDDWRMPTNEEFQELYNNTTVTWTTQNGVNGRLYTASNGNSLFLPAAGDCSYSSLYDAGRNMYYWSSSLRTDNPSYAWTHFYHTTSGYHNASRYYGRSIRPVRSGQN